jgi:hypothetical protein
VPIGQYNRHRIEHFAVHHGLIRQTSQGVAITLYLVTFKTAVDDRNVGTHGTAKNAQLLHYYSI